MIKKLLIAAIVLISQLSFAQNQWTQKADFGGGNGTGKTSFAIGAKGYFAIGNTSDLWEWNQATNTWSQKANFPGLATNQTTGFAIGTKGYIGTGYIAVSPFKTKEFWEWDQPTNTWTQKADYGGLGKTNAIGFSIGTKGYIGTGLPTSSSTPSQDLWEWDQLTNLWSQKANIPLGRYGAVAFSIGTKGYIGTGQNSYRKDFWEWDQAINTWTQKAELPGDGRYAATGFAIGAKGYIGLGRISSTVSTNDFWEWDQATNTWIQRSDFLGGSRNSAAGFSIGNKGYLGTGTSSSGAMNDFWEFDPNSCNANPLTASFEPTGYNYAPYPYYANSLGAGNSLRFKNNSPLADTAATFYWQVNGVTFDTTSYWDNGLNASFYSDDYTFNDTGTFIISMISTHLCQSDTAYDTIRVICPGVWIQKAPVGSFGRWGAAFFVIEEKAYIGTGGDDDYQQFNDFWEWNKFTNVWTQKADFEGGARVGASGFSIDDKGYFVAGNTVSISNIVYKKDLWEYNQATNSWTRKADFPDSFGRTEGAAFTISGKGYFGTGKNDHYPDYYFHDMWEYNPSNDSWSEKADMGNYGRIFAASFTLNGKGYVCPGYSYSDISGGNPSTFLEYNPISNIWVEKAECFTENWAASAFSVGNFGYLLEDGFQNHGKVIRYDPILDEWVKMSFVPIPNNLNRQHAFGFSIGYNGYIGTGNNNSIIEFNDFWEYHPDSCDAGIVTQVKPVEQSKPTVQVYPNPFKTQTTISLSTEVKNAVLKMYDVSGREVKRLTFTCKQVIIDREGLQSGVYIYSLSNNTQILATGKLVIE